MSFASETKKELTNIEVKDCCASAELSALIRMNGSLSFSNQMLVVNIQTENAAIARRIYTLIKKGYDTPVELLVRKKMRLKKKQKKNRHRRFLCHLRDLLLKRGSISYYLYYPKIVSLVLQQI